MRPVAQRAWDRRTICERLRVQQVQLPVREAGERANERACDRPPSDLELECDDATLSPRPEGVGVDADRHDAVVAFEPLGGGGHGLHGAREERVHPDPQTVATRPPSRVPEALGREERRRRQRMRRGEREIREARGGRLDAVYDVEVAPPQRKLEVRPDADRHPEVRPARDRDRRPDRDHLAVDAALEGAPAVEQIPGARGRRQHGDLVPEPAKRLRRPVHVHVHLVWLRPRERRDEADAEAHVARV